MRRLPLLVILAALVAGTGPAVAAKEDDGPAGRRPKHVVLVDWDGFDPDFLGRAPTPNLDALVGRAERPTHARASSS